MFCDEKSALVDNYAAAVAVYYHSVAELVLEKMTPGTKLGPYPTSVPHNPHNPRMEKNSCGVILGTGTPHHESSGLAVLQPTHRPSLMAFATERTESQ